MWECAVCRRTTEHGWQCPGVGNGGHHVLYRVADTTFGPGSDNENPFVAYDSRLEWARYASSLGLGHDARVKLIADTDDALITHGGVGFRVTPCTRANELSEVLGFTSTGGVWLKDETNNVGGSHKARFLMSIALVLLAEESVGIRNANDRQPLAIASCGNAALAAATLAEAIGWPLHVFVPEWGNPTVIEQIEHLGGTVTRCPRLPSDPPGDPCLFRFRETVAKGAIPFAVQGTENAYCNDGGRTLGWEIADTGVRFDRIFVSVGGGALATSVGQGLIDGQASMLFHPVQAQGCAPLARAWEIAKAAQYTATQAAAHWDECMWPWEAEPHSAATGILDDETYDWLGIFGVLDALGGAPITATEVHIAHAHDLVVRHSTIDADHTGTSGLAGLIAQRQNVGDHERVVVPITGRRR